jgi:ferredoxin
MDGDKCTVTVISHGRGENLICSKGSTLMDVFHKGNIYIDAPCGGKGICGKCKVLIIRGQVSEISQDESRYLSDKERAEGYRLACMTKVIWRCGSSRKKLCRGSPDHVHGYRILRGYLTPD